MLDHLILLKCEFKDQYSLHIIFVSQEKWNKKGRREKVGERRFVHLHDVLFFENSLEVDNIFCLSKYDYGF